MRESKFRAKKIDSEKWVYGGGAKTFGEQTLFLSEDEFHHPIIHLVKAETVGESIGLHDRNGNEIWEGDIVATFYKYTYEVRFGNFQSIVSGELSVGFYLFINGVCRPMSTIEREYEVIGNVYENPELLTPEDRLIREGVEECKKLMGGEDGKI